MYSQIDRNKRLTVIIIFFFILFVTFILWFFSFAYFGDLTTSILLGIFVFFISLISGLFSYFSGAAIVLAMNGAKDITDDPNYQDLNDRLNILCTKAGIPKPRLYILPDDALNAFATGTSPKKGHVAVTQGLIKYLERDEVDAVIAHELGHIRNYDIRLMMIVSVLAGVLTSVSDIFLRSVFWGRGNNKNRNGNAIFLIIAVVFAILSPIIAVLVQMAVSRRREFLADVTAVEITRYPQGMINALTKLQADTRPVRRASSGTAHMYIDFPLKDAGKFFGKIFSTHPPIEDRIAALQKI